MVCPLLGRLLTVRFLREKAETCRSHRDHTAVHHQPQIARTSLVQERLQDFATCSPNSDAIQA
tara:strand:- start:42 stop:230 length:189 start_codon:yes stop_codon:yes gene_type:complete